VIIEIIHQNNRDKSYLVVMLNPPARLVSDESERVGGTGLFQHLLSALWRSRNEPDPMNIGIRDDTMLCLFFWNCHAEIFSASPPFERSRNKFGMTYPVSCWIRLLASSPTSRSGPAGQVYFSISYFPGKYLRVIMQTVSHGLCFEMDKWKRWVIECDLKVIGCVLKVINEV